MNVGGLWAGASTSDLQINRQSPTRRCERGRPTDARIVLLDQLQCGRLLLSRRDRRRRQ